MQGEQGTDDSHTWEIGGATVEFSRGGEKNFNITVGGNVSGDCINGLVCLILGLMVQAAYIFSIETKESSVPERRRSIVLSDLKDPIGGQDPDYDTPALVIKNVLQLLSTASATSTSDKSFQAALDEANTSNCIPKARMDAIRRWEERKNLFLAVVDSVLSEEGWPEAHRKKAADMIAGAMIRSKVAPHLVFGGSRAWREDSPRPPTRMDGSAASMPTNYEISSVDRALLGHVVGEAAANYYRSEHDPTEALPSSDALVAALEEALKCPRERGRGLSR